MLPIQGAQVRSLVEELRFHILQLERLQAAMKTSAGKQTNKNNLKNGKY